MDENLIEDNQTVEPEKLDPRSHDMAEDKRKELLSLFPEIRTEGGKLDFDRLKVALGESVDIGKERYGMNWPGKAYLLQDDPDAEPRHATTLPRGKRQLRYDGEPHHRRR
jgi:adenine-specific DNA-methyltransferase